VHEAPREVGSAQNSSARRDEAGSAEISGDQPASCLMRSAQVRPVSRHVIDDGMTLADALGGKPLPVLIDLRGQSAECVHAHQ
jgi:hypothetical protein